MEFIISEVVPYQAPQRKENTKSHGHPNQVDQGNQFVSPETAYGDKKIVADHSLLFSIYMKKHLIMPSLILQ